MGENGNIVKQLFASNFNQFVLKPSNRLVSCPKSVAYCKLGLFRLDSDRKKLSKTRV